MESGTQTPNNGANTGLLVTPSPAQVKDRDRERDRARRVHREREARERDLSMSVQPIAPQSRQPSQHVPGGTPVGAVSPVTGNPGTSAAHHPYANPGVDVRGSNANVNGGMGMGAPSGIQMSGPYPRTTSNSPLPPLPTGEVPPMGSSSDLAQRNVVGAGTGLGAMNASGANGSRGELAGGYTRQRGVNGVPAAKARMSYDQVVGGTGVSTGYEYEQQTRGLGDGVGVVEGREKRRGIFSMLCCRA